MATNLATVRDRVEALLTDSGNSDWTTAELDQALRLALDELSQVCPARYNYVFDAVDDTYEYDLDSIFAAAALDVAQIEEVTEVWYPYLSTDDTYKLPHPVQWRMVTWMKLLLEPDSLGGDPDGDYDIRIFYNRRQQLDDLDSATATTLNAAEVGCLIMGAAGYAAIAKARYLANRVVTGENAYKALHEWGKSRVAEFKQRAYQLGQYDSAGEDARIGWWSADKWDV